MNCTNLWAILYYKSLIVSPFLSMILLQEQSAVPVNVCGEGGEYETFTLDCPMYKKRIVVYVWQVLLQSVCFLYPLAFVLTTFGSAECESVGIFYLLSAICRTITRVSCNDTWPRVFYKTTSSQYCEHKRNDIERASVPLTLTMIRIFYGWARTWPLFAAVVHWILLCDIVSQVFPPVTFVCYLSV